MAATSVTLVFLCVTLAGALDSQSDRVTRSSSAQVDAAGKVKLMVEEELTAMKNPVNEVVKKESKSKLHEAAAFAQIKPVLPRQDATLRILKTRLTDATLEFLQSGKVKTNDAQAIFNAMKPHIETLKRHTETQPEIKAVDAIDQERLAAYLEGRGASKKQMEEFNMLFGLQRLYEENGMSLAADKKDDIMPDLKRAIFGGELYQMLKGLALTSAFCPACGGLIFLIGIANLAVLDLKDKADAAAQ